MYINRKQILNSVLETVAGIANKEYQKRVWLRGEGPECDDFDETVCHFFEDGKPMLKEYKKFNISEGQYQILTKFYKEFDEFDDNHFHPLEFIDSPEWERIMNRAKEVLKAFNYQEKKD